jgi:hypothetical protein
MRPGVCRASKKLTIPGARTRPAARAQQFLFVDVDVELDVDGREPT